jgi:hypothetical protein
LRPSIEDASIVTSCRAFVFSGSRIPASLMGGSFPIDELKLVTTPHDYRLRKLVPIAVPNERVVRTALMKGT